MYRLYSGWLAYTVVVSRILPDCGDIAKMQHYRPCCLNIVFLALS